MEKKRKRGLLEKIRMLPGCEYCRDQGALWRIGPNGGAERCFCLRGILLTKLDEALARRKSAA